MGQPRTKINPKILKSMRMEAGLTQRELGERIGISRETVCAIETGKPYSLETIEAQVISAWHLTCKQNAKSETKQRLLQNILKYFGFSEEMLKKYAKSINNKNHSDN